MDVAVVVAVVAAVVAAAAVVYIVVVVVVVTFAVDAGTYFDYCNCWVAILCKEARRNIAVIYPYG